MKVKELLPQRVITAKGDSTVQEVAAKMRNFGVGILPILDDGGLIGVVTDRDIAVRAVATKPSCEDLLARDVMSPNPVTIPEDGDTEDAAVLMRTHRLHRLVVVNQKGRVSGVLSLTDLSLLDADSFEILKRLSEAAVLGRFPDEDAMIPPSYLP